MASCRDTRRCLRYLAFYGRDTAFVFIGDARIRQLYVAFVEHLQQQDDATTRAPEKVERRLTHIDNKLKIKVEYIWSGDISSDMVQQFR